MARVSAGCFSLCNHRGLYDRRRIDGPYPVPVTYAERGNPVPLPFGAGRPQGRLLGVRDREDGRSECPAVIAGIGACALVRKDADVRLVSDREKT